MERNGLAKLVTAMPLTLAAGLSPQNACLQLLSYYARPLLLFFACDSNRNANLSEEAILWAIYSISDNNSYLLFNR